MFHSRIGHRCIRLQVSWASSDSILWAPRARDKNAWPCNSVIDSPRDTHKPWTRGERAVLTGSVVVIVSYSTLHISCVGPLDPPLDIYVSRSLSRWAISFVVSLANISSHLSLVVVPKYAEDVRPIPSFRRSWSPTATRPGKPV